MATRNPDEVRLPRGDVVKVIKHLSTIVVSLDRIGSMAAEAGQEKVDEMTTAFLREWDVFARLAESRSLLSRAFSSGIGPDQMDELERELQGNEYWTPSARRHRGAARTNRGRRSPETTRT